MGFSYLPIAFVRRKFKLAMLIVITIGLAIYCVAESQMISRRRPYGQRSPPVVNWIHSRTARSENGTTTREDYGNQRRHHVDQNAGGLAEDTLNKCDQHYPQEANTDFNVCDRMNPVALTRRTSIIYVNPRNHNGNIMSFQQTFEMYKNGISSPGGATRIEGRKKTGKGPLKVFLLPMTHVDPGWLETFDSYTTVTNSILDNMLTFLNTHPKMRFMWCEIVFFERWWSKLNETQRGDVRRFVASGQLEMASGSWVMTDEANPFFPVTIDNIIEGQQFIFHELGAKARTMWSNDPFGYGSSVTYLFTKTGIKWAIINRIHHSMKNFLYSYRAVPFNWRQYFDVKGESDVYTHVLPYAHYDVLNSCGPMSSVCCEFDFKRLTHFSCPSKRPVITTPKNVAERAKLLEEQFHMLSNIYETDVLLAVWGDDFRYSTIEEWHQQYDNLEPIFEHINAGGRTQIRFGTFVDYFTALENSNKEKSTKPFTLSGDFFPYQCALGDLWTGYYTTRPFYKKQERQLHALIRGADLAITSVLTKLSDAEKKWMNENLVMAKRNLSLFQHHDAITGTSKKHVMSDYAHILFGSMRTAAKCLTKAIGVSNEMHFQINEMPVKYDQIPSKEPLLISPDSTISVAVYNSVERKRLETISLVVSTYMVSVMHNGKVVKAQIEPYVDPVTGTLTSHFNLIFHTTLPPLSTKIFTIKSIKQHSGTDIADILFVDDAQNNSALHSADFPKVFNIRLVPNEQFVIQTDSLKTTHSLHSGLIKTVETRSIGALEFIQTIDQYVGSGGGPYVMHQNGPSRTFDLPGLSRFIIKGPLQQSAYVHSEHLLQKTTVRDVPGNEGEQLHISMRIDIRTLAQVELITRFTMDLDRNSTEFYTDSNGLQLLKREYNEQLPLKANYYPMPTSLMLQDHSRRVSIVSDVEHGVTLYSRTTPEIMLDRILLRDDGKGLGSDDDSILNDILPVEIGFTVVFERISEINRPIHFAYHTPLAHMALQSLLYKPIILTSKDLPSTVSAPSLSSFPCDLQLVTCRPIASHHNQRLLILHRPGMDCSSKESSQCASIDFTSAVRDYLKSVGAVKAQKTTLNGIDNISAITEVDKVQFHIEPMDFAAFVVTFV